MDTCKGCLAVRRVFLAASCMVVGTVPGAAGGWSESCRWREKGEREKGIFLEGEAVTERKKAGREEIRELLEKKRRDIEERHWGGASWRGAESFRERKLEVDS